MKHRKQSLHIYTCTYTENKIDDKIDIIIMILYKKKKEVFCQQYTHLLYTISCVHFVNIQLVHRLFKNLDEPKQF